MGSRIPQSEAVLGIDFRISPTLAATSYWTPALRETHLLKPDIPIPATFDRSIWLSIHDDDARTLDPLASDLLPRLVNFRLNALDLYPLTSADAFTKEHSKNVWTIAITVLLDRLAAVESFCGPLGITHLGSSEHSATIADWEFLGYDVVDCRTGVSGLTNCGLGRFRGEQVWLQAARNLSEYGLISSIDIANDLCAKIGAVIPDHSPFEALGLYARVHSKRRGQV